MTTKILIVDDIESMYQKITILFNQVNEQADNSYHYIPDNVKEFHKIRSKFNSMNSPIEEMRNSAVEYLTALTQGVDLLLLDYQLMEHGGIRTGLDLYNELQLEKKALIYTNSGSTDLEDIERRIYYAKLNERIFVLPKPLFNTDRDYALLGIPKPQAEKNKEVSILKRHIDRILQ